MLPLRPPIAPMLAKLETEIPRADGWLYEPKWDGFRAIVFKDGESVQIASRDKRPLERYFPELAETLARELPLACVVDGEIVITGRSGLDFDALLLRIHPAPSRIRLLARDIPASFIAFDLLALNGDDLRSVALIQRRERLLAALAGVPQASESAARQPGSRLLVTPQTDDPEEAARWFDEFETVGLDGIVAKRCDLSYLPGERVMVKVKHRRTVDCVVGGYRLDKSRMTLGALLVGLYDSQGVLHYVGHTSSFSAAQRAEMLERLRPLEGEESFGRGRTPGGLSRWSAGRDRSWVSVAPVLACEVSFDYLQGDRFRHAARFERWRPDKPPLECTLDQISRLRSQRAQSRNEE